MLFIKFILLSSFILFMTSLNHSCSKNTDQDQAVVGPNPYYDQQWHLYNSGQNGATAGEDINVTSVWDAGIKGTGVLVALVDDGLEIAHEDIAANFSSTVSSYNYYYGGTDPTSPGSTHGTCVGGLIAAVEDNFLGGKGVAPSSKLVAYNLITSNTFVNNSSTVADALTRNYASVYISNNSWGFSDGYGNYDGRNSDFENAIETGIDQGRSGKGTVYVWAGGNGGEDDVDNSNYDSYANFYGVMAICATGPDGQRAYYSEKGANLWVCSPSMGYLSSTSSTTLGVITTDKTSGGYNTYSATDFGNRAYTKWFSGTSAAAPIAAGAVALVMEANPNLTWRDVRYIMAQSARKNDPTDSDWTTNGAGFDINHQYGFGVIDVAAAVSLAQGWTNLGTLITYNEPTGGVQAVGTAISDNPTPATATSSTISVAGSGISKIEYVQVQVTLNHTDWGDLRMVLRRTSGGYTTESILSTEHQCYATTGSVQSCDHPSDDTWIFGVARDLGEAADGDWTLDVYDKISSNTGTLTSWRLTIYGT